jgi:hypothetical protein
MALFTLLIPPSTIFSFRGAITVDRGVNSRVLSCLLIRVEGGKGGDEENEGGGRSREGVDPGILFLCPPTRQVFTSC